MNTNHIPELATPPVLIVWLEDPIIHDEQHPFCSDDSCPCHEDSDLMDEYIIKRLDSGLISNAEAVRLYWDGNAVAGTVEDEDIEDILTANTWEEEEEDGRYRRQWLSEHL